MDRNLMPCLLERPSDPVRLGAISRVETDEELLFHRSLYRERDFRNFVFLVFVVRSSPSPRECLEGSSQVWFGVFPSRDDRAARPRLHFTPCDLELRGFSHGGAWLSQCRNRL